MIALGLVLNVAGLVVWAVSTVRYRWRITLGDVIALALVTAGDVVRGSFALAAVSAALAVWASWICWNRRKRRRAPRALGARARARIAAMVTRMRERPARPVLRPAAGGAR